MLHHESWGSSKRLFARVARRGLLLCTAAIAVLLSVGRARAEHITGKLINFQHLRNPVWVEAKDASKHGYTFRELVPTVPAEFRKLFPHIPKEVCIAAIAVANQAPKPPVLIRVGGGRTTPVTIVVPPKTKLTFKNTDPFTHRLYAVGLKTFAANDTARGAEREWSPPDAGVYEIRDELAPSLRMWVVADPKVSAIAYPSMKGEFSITVDEPGDYTIQTFFAGKKVGPALPVTVNGKDVVIRGPIKVADPPKKEKKK